MIIIIVIIAPRYFKAILSQGLAIVSVDVRGTGASFGKHLGPWTEEERGVSLRIT
ncbi:unnamed protein product [Discosporangium mesarthrocarpum]